MMPGLPIIDALLNMQVINGLLLPVLLIAILRLVNDEDLMGKHKNGPLYNVLAWLTAVLVSALSIFFIITKIFPGILSR
jgi:Mn2+/Fe2+ NRAMP family transporter